MKIGINMKTFSSIHPETGEYILKLLLKFQRFDTKNEFFLFSNTDFDFPVFNPTWHKVVEHLNPEDPPGDWENIIFPQLIKKYECLWLWEEAELFQIQNNLLAIVGGISFHHYFLLYSEIKEALDRISPSFCLAKWLQVTLHLENGFTHSCHHPNTHKIPLEELKHDPSALHNTTFKKLQRKLMLDGKRPPECIYCWNTEDSPGKDFSDRILKSADPWAFPYLNKVVSHHWKDNINPTYLEVSFGSECNFKCAYCAPDISSPIWSEYEKLGPYPTHSPANDLNWMIKQGRKPYLTGENNPYVEAFWKWFPTIARDLLVFRITGGEPLINPNTFMILDFIDRNPLPQLQFSINTNMCVPNRNYKKFISKISALLKGKKIKGFKLFASIDTHGAQSEYIRFGLNYKTFINNVYYYLDNVPCQLSFMVTFNLLSIPRFINFLEDVLILQKLYDSNPELTLKYGAKIFVDISYLRFPDYLSTQIVDDKLLKRIKEIRSFMILNSKQPLSARHMNYGFSEYEINKVSRIISWIESSKLEKRKLIQLRSDFYSFITEYDRRKDTNFLSTFPELSDFYMTCKEHYLQSSVYLQDNPVS